MTWVPYRTYCGPDFTGYGSRSAEDDDEVAYVEKKRPEPAKKNCPSNCDCEECLEWVRECNRCPKCFCDKVYCNCICDLCGKSMFISCKCPRYEKVEAAEKAREAQTKAAHEHIMKFKRAEEERKRLEAEEEEEKHRSEVKPLTRFCTSPTQYGSLLDEMEATGKISPEKAYELRYGPAPTKSTPQEASEDDFDDTHKLSPTLRKANKRKLTDLTNDLKEANEICLHLKQTNVALEKALHNEKKKCAALQQMNVTLELALQKEKKKSAALQKQPETISFKNQHTSSESSESDNSSDNSDSDDSSSSSSEEEEIVITPKNHKNKKRRIEKAEDTSEEEEEEEEEERIVETPKKRANKKRKLEATKDTATESLLIICEKCDKEKKESNYQTKKYYKGKISTITRKVCSTCRKGPSKKACIEKTK